MDQITMSAETRTATGKGANKRLRRDGVIPIVVYGGTVDGALSLSVSERELLRVLSAAGASRVITLQVGSEQDVPVLARSVQRDPLRHNILHADFLAVRLDRTIQAEIPVIVVGDTTAIEEANAVLAQVVDTLTVEALPNDLPNQLEVDVSGLSEIGQQITVSDLAAGARYTIMADPEALVVSVTQAARAPSTDDELDAATDGVDELETDEEEAGSEADGDEADES